MTASDYALIFGQLRFLAAVPAFIAAVCLIYAIRCNKGGR